MGKVALPSTQWYQSRSSRPDAGKTVLEGTCFAHKIVADFPTIEMAERAVRAVNAYEPMLAALKLAEANLVKWVGEPPLLRNPVDAENNPTRHASWKAIEEARAAIAKAEGELCRGGAKMVEMSELRA